MQVPSICQVLGSLVVVLISRRLYIAFYGPLAKLPGPIISRVSSARFILAVFSGRQIFYVDDLLDEYGPIVRVTPNYVAVSDPDLVREIHKIRTRYRKAKWYNDFTGGIKNIFTIRDPHEHASRRRLLGSQLTESALKSVEHIVLQKIQKGIAKMTEEAKGNSGVVDIQKWSYATSADVIGQLSFNEDFGLLDTGEKNSFLKSIQTINMRAIPSACFPSLNGWLGRLPGFRGPRTAVAEVRSHGRRVMKQYLAFIQSDTAAADKHPTLFSKILSAKEEGALTVDDLAMEATNYNIAGTDTTAITVSYLIWALAKDLDLQEKLNSALADVSVDNQSLKNIPFIENLICEALRLYGAAPGMLPREVPPSGASFDGHFVPGGVTVITQPWTQHHDPVIFEDPDEFMPERWEEPSQAMKDSFMPWGGGARACLGQNLAMMELRLGLASFFKTFPTIGVADTAGPHDMDIINYFVIIPKGEKNLIQVYPR